MRRTLLDSLPDCLDPATPVPGGPLTSKQGIVVSLQALQQSLSPANQRKVAFAVARLTRTLDGALWADGWHLGPHGSRVFHLDALALTSLGRVRPPIAGITAAIDAVVDSDRTLATIVIAGARGDARWMAQALSALNAGDRQRARHRTSLAVQHYRAAGAFARRAPSLFPAAAELHEANDALTGLIPGATHSNSVRLARAVGHLQSALQPALWVDASHLARRCGDTVFTHLSNALTALDYVSTQPEIVDGAIDALIAISRALAETAVDQAEASGESARDIARAREWLERGDDDRDGGRNAIDHYRQAWTTVR